MLNNRDRRNGLILSSSSFNQQKKSYGRFNKGSKTRYNLNDLVLDMSSSPSNRNSTTTNRSSLNSAHAFDISNDSFKLSDDEYDGPVTRISSSYDQDTADQGSMTCDTSDGPFGMAQIISVAISDNEDSDAMDTPEREKLSTKRNSRQLLLESTPVKSSHTTKKSKPVLQELSPLPLNTSSNILTSDIAEKRVPMIQPQQPPTFQRNSSSNLRNRASINSQTSKRWSLMSFNAEDKENMGGNKIKRFSIASGQSGSSKDKSKRFSISSTLSTTSSSSSSFRNAVTKVGNVLSSVSVNSTEDSAESTPYKNVKPGVVGDTQDQLSPAAKTLRSPVNPRQYSQASLASQSITISSYQNKRTQEYNQSKTINAPPTSASAMRVPSQQYSHMSDQASVISVNSSLKSSRSRFRLSSLFSSAKKELPVAGDNESVRSLRSKSSFSDMRKSVLTYSQSKTSLFRLTKKDSMHDLKRKPSLDKSMISLPRPDSETAKALKTKLRNSSSILSISSVVSRQPTLATVNTTYTPQTSNTSALNSSMNTTLKKSSTIASTSNTTITAMASNDFEDVELKKILELTSVNHVMEFKDYISNLANVDNQILVKFAEASYSEVFVLKNFESGENLKIFKIIPFGEVNFEQPSIKNIIQELKITKRLSSMDGFIHMNSSCVVQGAYPKLLLKLWDDFNELKESRNYRPEFEEDQKYLILDLEYGGVDLERFPLMTWKQALDVFWSVVKTLDFAEKRMKFEHRDLHWGNVVIDYTQKKRKSNEPETIQESENLEDAFQDLSILEENEEEEDDSEEGKLCVKLIDYTLSRLNDEEGGEVIYTGLDHQDFFKGRGDYQFDIYRFMRNELKSLQEGNGNEDVDWSLNSFKNNLYWLHYLLDKILHSKGIRDTENKQAHKNVEILYKCLDPRKKKLNSGEPVFKSSGKKSLKKSSTQKPSVFFEDFDNSGDVLRFGEYYNMI